MISLRVLTYRQQALLLYNGPLGKPNLSAQMRPSPLLALQVVDGLPQMIIEVGGGAKKLQVNTAVNDGNWHTIHLKVDTWGVALMIDLCGQGWEDERATDSHCIARMAWSHPMDHGFWFSSNPIQLGGLAHSPPKPAENGWHDSPISSPLKGCLSHLAINGQFVDLGEPPLAQGSSVGCVPQDAACYPGMGSCGFRGSCVGGLNHPQCHCEPGWNGEKCGTSTLPVSLNAKSYMKVALSFTPASWIVSVQIRVRVRGRHTGLLVRLSAQQIQTFLSLELEGGIACASFTTPKRPKQVACVIDRPVGDAMWHTIRAERHGHNLLIFVDDGDGVRHNHSLPYLNLFQETDELSTKSDFITEPPLPMNADSNNGITIGGLPEFLGVKLITVYDDLKEACLDDLRVSGQSLPLAPTTNGTAWGQVSTFENVGPFCDAADSCQNITCSPPLTCISNWGRPTCSCGEGRQLIGGKCEDVDECVWQPCLHGGTCYNMRPGFMCICGPSHTGSNCQWSNHNSWGYPLASSPAAIAAITLTLLLLAFVGVVLSVRLRSYWSARNTPGKRSNDEDTKSGSPLSVTKVRKEEREEKGDGVRGGCGYEIKDNCTQELLLESINLKLPQIKPSHQTEVQTAFSIKKDGFHMRKSSLSAPTSLGIHERVFGDNLFAKDDLRAYAYEGDGSTSGSLTSALS
ncbi:hypothetical protein SK128_018162, partial [Halocaridina rubra]